MIKKNKEKFKGRIFLLLHLLLIFYSFSGIFSKLAGKYDFMSSGFIIYYGLMVLILAVYAIGWQQIIKKLPLTAAFANKAVTVVWGAIWGVIVFNEKISINRLIGIALVVGGIVLYALSDVKGESTE